MRHWWIYLLASALENYLLDSLALIGSVIENVAPRSGLLAAQTLPLWRSTMVRLIASPIPRPSRLFVTKGSKMDSSFSGAIPVPLSCSSTRTFEASIDFVRTIRRRAPLSWASPMALKALSIRFSITCWS